jgi:SAM-dependent methyltransferase
MQVKNSYLNGHKLIGDDFDENQIAEWFKEELEYSKLYPFEGKSEEYPYHQLNCVHGFNHLPLAEKFETVVSFGGGFCEELLPIKSKLNNIYVIEPSDDLTQQQNFGIPLHYIKPAIDGKIPLDSNSVDLITCFGVLHHIPNISFVMSELYRILKPDGHILIREPIKSMGDWSKIRPGLTKNERGIPKKIFKEIVLKTGFKIQKSSLCFTKPFDLLWAKIFKNHLFLLNLMLI